MNIRKNNKSFASYQNNCKYNINGQILLCICAIIICTCECAIKYFIGACIIGTVHKKKKLKTLNLMWSCEDRLIWSIKLNSNP